MKTCEVLTVFPDAHKKRLDAHLVSINSLIPGTEPLDRTAISGELSVGSDMIKYHLKGGDLSKIEYHSKKTKGGIQTTRETQIYISQAQIETVEFTGALAVVKQTAPGSCVKMGYGELEENGDLTLLDEQLVNVLYNAPGNVELRGRSRLSVPSHELTWVRGVEVLGKFTDDSVTISEDPDTKGISFPYKINLYDDFEIARMTLLAQCMQG